MRRGFTLIELMVTVAISSLLLAIISIGIGNARATSRDTQRIRDVNMIAKAVESYASAHHNQYPGKYSNGPGSSIVGHTCAQYIPEFYASPSLRTAGGQASKDYFPGGIIPVDPKPQNSNIQADCAYAKSGYLYVSQYSQYLLPTNKLTAHYDSSYYNIGQTYRTLATAVNARTYYAIIVQLEQDKPSDDQSVTKYTDVSTNVLVDSNKQNMAANKFNYYYFFGPSCTPTIPRSSGMGTLFLQDYCYN